MNSSTLIMSPHPHSWPSINILSVYMSQIIAYSNIMVGVKGEWLGLEDFSVMSRVLQLKIFRTTEESKVRIA